MYGKRRPIVSDSRLKQANRPPALETKRNPNPSSGAALLETEATRTRSANAEERGESPAPLSQEATQSLGSPLLSPSASPGLSPTRSPTASPIRSRRTSHILATTTAAASPLTLAASSSPSDPIALSLSLSLSSSSSSHSSNVYDADFGDDGAMAIASTGIASNASSSPSKKRKASAATRTTPKPRAVTSSSSPASAGKERRSSSPSPLISADQGEALDWDLLLKQQHRTDSSRSSNGAVRRKIGPSLTAAASVSRSEQSSAQSPSLTGLHLSSLPIFAKSNSSPSKSSSPAVASLPLNPTQVGNRSHSAIPISLSKSLTAPLNSKSINGNGSIRRTVSSNSTDAGPPPVASSRTASRLKSSSNSSSSLASSMAAPSLTGENRRLMDELQYLLDGIKSTDLAVRHQSAFKLAAFFHSSSTSNVPSKASNSNSSSRFNHTTNNTNQHFHLMRSSGGFSHFCQVYDEVTADSRSEQTNLDEIISMSFACCLYLMSREKSNAAFITSQGARLAIEILKEKSRGNKIIEGEKEKEEKEQENDRKSAIRIRSRRVKITEKMSVSSFTRLLESDPLLSAIQLPISAPYLCLHSLLPLSENTQFKSVLYDADALQVIPSLLFNRFSALISALPCSNIPGDDANPSETDHSVQSFHFDVQALLSILENLTHSHDHNQNALLNSPLIDPTGTLLLPQSLVQVPVLDFPSLFFIMLQYFAKTLNNKKQEKQETDRISPARESTSFNSSARRNIASGAAEYFPYDGSATGDEDVGEGDDLVDSSQAASFISDSGSPAVLLQLLFRLLVNLTNKSARAAELLMQNYLDITSANDKENENRGSLIGAQLIASVVSQCWYHPVMQTSLANQAKNDFFDVLTLGLGVLINICEQSDQVRRFLAHSCFLQRRSDDLAIALMPMTGENEAEPLAGLPQVVLPPTLISFTWLDCCLDIFVRSYLRLHELSSAQQAQQNARTNNPERKTVVPLPRQPRGGQYGKRQNSSSGTQTVALSSTAPASSVGVSGLDPIDAAESEVYEQGDEVDPLVEQEALCHRIICSYAAMILALLACEDDKSFALVQSRIRARPENQAHYRAVSPTLQPLLAPSPTNGTLSRAPSAPLPLNLGPAATFFSSSHNLSERRPASPQPASQPAYTCTDSPSSPLSPRSPSSNSPSKSVIFSLRLVVRMLNEFLILQSETLVTEESLEGILAVIDRLQKIIKARDTISS